MRAEFATQLSFILKICLFPLILVSFVLSYGPAGIQAGNFLGLFARSTASAPPTRSSSSAGSRRS